MLWLFSVAVLLTTGFGLILPVVGLFYASPVIDFLLYLVGLIGFFSSIFGLVTKLLIVVWLLVFLLTFEVCWTPLSIGFWFEMRLYIYFLCICIVNNILLVLVDVFQ